MAGESAERQERGVITAINGCVKLNNNKPIIVSGEKNIKTEIKSVTRAEKFNGRSESGSEPYTDLMIYGTKTYNISNKGEAAPSLAGGGLSGIEFILPGLVESFLIQGVKEYKKKRIRENEVVPELYGKVAVSDVKLILKGNKKMGGPIDFMYIGPMDVTRKFENGKCILNGGFYTLEQYIAKIGGSLYLRARKRREDQPFVGDAILDKAGLPAIYGKSPSRGDSGRRIVVIDKAPSTALTFNLSPVGK